MMKISVAPSQYIRDICRIRVAIVVFIVLLITLPQYYYLPSTGGGSLITLPANEGILVSPLPPHSAHTRSKVKPWVKGKDTNAILATINAVQKSVCDDKKWDGGMKYLCLSYFIKTATQLLLEGKHVDIVQIGAHVGFESNDPIAKGLSLFLDELVNATDNTMIELRTQFHWTFVEPSPPNIRGLEANTKKYGHVCDMRVVRAAVVSDLAENPLGHMTFYGISDDIDPVSGFDSRSKKMLPDFLTQISSLSREQVFSPLFVKAFRKFGLEIDDYVVETNVTTLSYSDLMKQVLVPTDDVDKGLDVTTANTDGPLLTLIDTEGFDCSVVEGISPNSPYLPKYLVFEHIHCDAKMAIQHLGNMGFTTEKASENMVAIHVIAI